MRTFVKLILVVGMIMTVGQPSSLAAGDAVDESFGVHGTLRTNLGGTYDWAYGVAVQPDGKILAAGVSNAGGTYDFALARYTAEHELDPSFGNGGIVTTDFADSYDWGHALALQPDGKIVVGGVSDAGGSRDFALARYENDGDLDRHFGRGGLVTSDLLILSSDTIHALALQPDGRIVAAGVTFDDKATVQPHGDFMVARYTASGQPDPSFGVGGMVTTGFGTESYDEPYAVALQPDGGIVVGGETNSTGGSVVSGHGVAIGADQLALARYTPEGLLDGRFGQGGRVSVDAGGIDEGIRSLALDGAGRIVAAGFTHGEKRGDALAARFVGDGSLDPSFGTGGLSIHDFTSLSERLTAVAIQPDGTIVAGGQVATKHDADFAVVRYGPDGALDQSFARQGLALVDFGGREDKIHAIALQPDGKLVAVGKSEADFALARFRAR